MRVKVFTNYGWVEIPPQFHNVIAIEDRRIMATRVSGVIEFTAVNEYLCEHADMRGEE